MPFKLAVGALLVLCRAIAIDIWHLPRPATQILTKVMIDLGLALHIQQDELPPADMWCSTMARVQICLSSRQLSHLSQ